MSLILKEKLLQASPLGLTFAVMIGAAYRDMNVLTTYPIAVGVDGYYYALQVKQILTSGHLYFSSSGPLPVYVMALFSTLTGDPILSIKIVAVFFELTLYSAIFGLLTSVGYSRWIGVLGVSFAAFSGLHFYMISEFINNLAGLMALLVSVWTALLAIKTRARVWRYLAIALFLAAVFSHKSILPAAVILLILILLSRSVLRLGSLRYAAFLIAIVAVAYAGTAFVAAQPFIQLPQWLQHELVPWPHLPFGRVALTEKLILAASVPAVLFVIGTSTELRSGIAPTLLCTVGLWTLLVTLNPFFVYEIGWTGFAARLSGLSYLQVAILVPGLIAMLMKIRPALNWYAAAVLLPLFLLSVNSPLPAGMQPTYLNDRGQIIRSLLTEAAALPRDSAIVAEHGMQFVATYVTGLKGFSQLPKGLSATGIHWILVGVAPSTVDTNMQLLAESAHGSFVVLVNNEDLSKKLQVMTEGDKRRLFAVNRHLYQSCLSHGLADASGQCIRLP